MVSLALFVNGQIIKRKQIVLAATIMTIYLIQTRQQTTAQVLQGTVREYQSPLQQYLNEIPPLGQPGMQTTPSDSNNGTRLVPYPYVLYQQPQSQQQPSGNYNQQPQPAPSWNYNQQPQSQQFQQQQASSAQPYNVLLQGSSVDRGDPYNLLPWPLGCLVKKLVTNQHQQNSKKQKKMQAMTAQQAMSNYPPLANTVDGGQENRLVSWDQWYRRLSLVDDPIMNQSLANHRFPTGVAHLWVTVTPTHQLTAQLLDSTSRRFGLAALEGVQVLDGNQALEYPIESLRKTVSFKWVANHRGKAGRAPDVIQDSTIVGDYEKQYRQW